MAKVDGKETKIYDGVVRIMCGDRARTEYITANGEKCDKSICLDDCLELIAYEDEQDDIVYVVFDEPLSGKIYQYGNYAEGGWWEYGTTCGFA